MSKRSWILLALLVATNGIWLIREWGRAPDPDGATPRAGQRTHELGVPTEGDRAAQPAGARPEQRLPEATQPPTRPRSLEARGRRWVEAMAGDAEARRAALEEIRVALAADDADAARMALSALWLAPPAEVADPEWTALAERHLAAERPDLRRAALLALRTTRGLRPEHLAAAAADPAPEVRAGLAAVLRHHYYRDPESGDEWFLRLLADPADDVVRTTIEMLPANVGPLVQDRLAALARTPAWRKDAMRKMAMLVEKAPAVLKELALALAQAEPDVASVAGRGLMRDVPEGWRAEVADAALQRLERGEKAVAPECLALLSRYGSEDDVPRLERAVAGADEATRREATEAVAAIRHRHGR